MAAQGRAVAADVFCEQGVFTADQSRRILTAAAGVRPAPAAACRRAGTERRRGARGGDRGARPPTTSRRRRRPGSTALAAAAADGQPVVATLLPATTWFLMKDHHAPARTFIEHGVPVAIGTDFNPGTSPTPSLPLAMTAACLNLRMTPDEVLAAVTINAAQALGLADEIGSLEGGKQADLVIWDVPTSRQIPYWPAADLVRTVVKRGRVVLDGLSAGVPPRRSAVRPCRATPAGRSSSRAAGPEIVTDSFGWTAGSPPISWKNLASASRVSGASSSSGHRDDDLRIELGDELGDPLRRERAADRDAGDVDRADVGELLLGQQMADLAEVDRVHPVELDDERDLLAALRALRVVAVGPDAGQEHVADLVLARPVEDERVLERGRQERRAVARALALGLGQRPVVRMGVRDDLAGDPAAGRPDDRSDRGRPRRRRPCPRRRMHVRPYQVSSMRRFLHTRLHRGCAARQPADRQVRARACVSVRSSRWGEHGKAPPSTAGATRTCEPAAADVVPATGVRQRAGAPAQSAPPLGGREDGTLRVRSEMNTRPGAFNDNRESH